MALILGRQTGTRRKRIGFGSTQPESGGDLITYSGDGHLITFAPTGTGKTSGPVITNALSHPGQVICIDVKGEIHAATATRRSEIGPVHVLDLRDGGIPGSLNPLDMAIRGGEEVGAIARSFAGEFIERPSSLKDRFWSDWSENLIAGGMAWLLTDAPPEERNVVRLFDLYTSDDPTYRIAKLLDDGKVTARTAKAVFASLLNLPGENTRPSVFGTVQADLRLFESDLTRRLTDTTSIDHESIRLLHLRHYPKVQAWQVRSVKGRYHSSPEGSRS